LQPNQYLKGSKPLSEVEKTTAIDPARYGYFAPMLRFKAEFQALVEKGMTGYDFTEVFKETEDTVYIDRCCHVNDLGNEILAKAVVSRIVSAETRSRRPPAVS
jgi:hypothetical protein